MALDLNEYIKMSYERPNRKVLEGLGASEGLIEYLMETPGNTNWNIVEAISENSSDIQVELPYTFHFTAQEVETGGETTTEYRCNEVKTWNDIFSLSGNGTIVKATFTNITEKEDEYVEDNCEYMTYKKDENLGSYSGAAAWNWKVINKNGFHSIEVNYMPEILVNDLIFKRETEITLELQEGYIITLIPSQSEEAQFVEDYCIFIKKGNTYTIDFGSYTDGINIYKEGDIITPTSDMTLTAFEITATFYDENHNLMEGVQRYITQDQSYPYTNPYKSTKFALPNRDKNGLLNGTWSWHDSEGDHTASPTTTVTITEPTDFIFHPTA